MFKYFIIVLAVLAVVVYGIYVLAPQAVKPSGGRKRWAYLFGGVLLGEVIITALSPLFGWDLPGRHSTYAGDVDLLFFVILAVTGITFLGVGAIFIYVLFKYVADPTRKSIYTHGSHKLEMAWTATPGILLFLLAIGQIPAWVKVKLHNVDDAAEAIQMEVSARQWEWRVRYPSSAHMAEWRTDPANAKHDFAMRLADRPDDLRLVNEVHCVKGKKVYIHLRTQDVIHSFFLPHMRLKQDALPGKTIPVWFEPTDANCEKVGDTWVDGRRHDAKKGWVEDPAYIWELACAEYCGSRHSMMRGKLFVHETMEDYQDWLKSAEARQRFAGAEAK